MGYIYGIEVARQTIEKLSTDEPFNKRLSNAFSELDVIESEDVTPEHYKEIEEWKKQYLNKGNSFINEQGELEKPEVTQTMKELANKLVWLTFSICKANTLASIKDNNKG